MTDSIRQIRQLLDRVRARWRRLAFARGVLRGGLAAAAVLATAVAVAPWLTKSPAALGILGLLALLGAVAAWCGSSGRSPRFRPIAGLRVSSRERDASLDDRLVTAVDMLSRPEVGTGASDANVPLAAPMLADAARAADRIDPLDLISSERMRSALGRRSARSSC